MKIEVKNVPMENKWTMTAMGLTGALSIHLNALYEIVGKQQYSQIVRQLWARMGEGTAEQVESFELPIENAQDVARAGATMCLCSMGPELKIEEVESSDQRTVMKITECPWNNRMKEAGISHDLLTACDTPFWNHFVTKLNPNVRMKHGKEMHRGDPFCEWIFELKKNQE